MTDTTPSPVDYARRHFRFGWWSLLAFAAFGFALELLHGFKIRAYLDVSNETRRLMWTLAHAHGSLLGLVHVLFAVSLRTFPEISGRTARTVSRCLILASVLLPGGFLIGGMIVYAGDPGLGVLLVPLGAALLLIAIFSLVSGTRFVDTPAPRVGAEHTRRHAPSR
jgi:hypothetical protein